MDLDEIFAYGLGVLAALAVVGALAFVLVWEWCAIRRTLAAHRRPAPEGFWRGRSAIVPTVQAEGEPIREGARRILAGDPLREIALDWKGRGSRGQRQP